MATKTALDSMRMEKRVSQASVEEYAARATEALLQGGVAALKNEDYKKALRIFERLSQKGGRSFLVELGKVLAFNGLGQREQSVQTLQGMLGLGDDNEVMVRIGLAQGQMGKDEDALDTFRHVIEQWPDDADALVFRSPSLLKLMRIQEAIDSLEEAHTRRRQCSVSGMWSLYYCSALLWLGLGVSSIEMRSLPDLETATKAFIMWQERARRDKQTAAFREAVDVTKNLTPEDSAAYEEFMLSVRLGSIEDPFEGWKALAEEIGKVWPKGVSAVGAIREQRD